MPTLTEVHDFDTIVASSSFAFALKNGELWGCGANERGQLGNGTVKSVNQYVKVPFPKRVIQVACGWEHSVVLTVEGSVFVAGYGAKGQLGLDKDKLSCAEFNHLFLPAPIKQVCCGVWFTLALGEDEKVYGWGSNRDRCLSVEPIDSFFAPIALNFISNVRKLVAGHRHVIALKENETVFAWGDNRYQQITSYTGKVIDCFAGWHHTVLQVAENEIFICGKNDYNQLAHADSSAKQNRLSFPVPIRSIAVGSDHSLVLLESGELQSYGWNEHGVLGDDSNETRHGTISKVNFDSQIKRIFCGYGSCFIISRE